WGKSCTADRSGHLAAWGGHLSALAFCLSRRGRGVPMLRPMSLVVAVLLALCLPTLAATEADKQACVVNPSPDARIEACTRVLIDPSATGALRGLALRNRAAAYVAKRMFSLAVLDLDEAIRLGPPDPALFGGRAWALFELGKYDRSIADYDEQLRLNPRSDAAHNNRGLARTRNGDPPGAPADCEAAIKINPRNLHARTNRGLALARQQKLDEAIAEYSSVLRIDPDYLLAYSNRARAYEVKGDIALALADYKQVVDREGRAKSSEAERTVAGARQQVARLTKALAEGAVTERRVALVIGNSEYRHVPVLPNPANDAKLLAAALRAVGFADVRELANADLSTHGQGAEGVRRCGHGCRLGRDLFRRTRHRGRDRPPVARARQGFRRQQDAARRPRRLPQQSLRAQDAAGRPADAIHRQRPCVHRARKRRAHRLCRARRHDGARRRQRQQPLRAGAGEIPVRARSRDQPALPQGA